MPNTPDPLTRFPKATYPPESKYQTDKLLGHKDHTLHQLDPVVSAVCSDLLSRSSTGQRKYGTTLARTDLSLRDWLQHAYEETLDSANYLKRAIMELDAQAIVQKGKALPILDSRTPDEIIGYNEQGHFDP